MQKILVPVDFSPCSINAVKYASHISNSFSAELCLLHVCHFPINVLEAPAEMLDNEKILEEAENDMKKFITENLAQISRISYKIHQGLAADVIANYSESENCDLVVMGTKGATGIEKSLLGSIASSVLDKTNSPVIVVPMSASFALDHICFATDYKENNFAKLDPLFSLCKIFKSKLSIIHATAFLANDEMAYDVMHQYEAAFRKNSEGVDLSFHLLTGENEIDTIDQYIIQNHCTLLVVSPEQHNFITRIFNPSLTKELVCQSKIPILAIPV